MARGLDIITDAMAEIGAIAAGEPIQPQELAFALGRLNTIVDAWNAERSQVYADVQSTFTLVPGTSPHTIGPAASTPTWTMATRPVSILALSLIQPSGVRLPLRMHHGIEWWSTQRVPTLPGTLPIDVCYVPDWPLGLLFFWPVPSAALGVELYARVVFAAFDLQTDFSLAPGYNGALVSSLAEDLCAPFGKPCPPALTRKAEMARARIQRNNAVSPKISTTDAGIPGGGRSGWWDYQTGLVR